MRTNLTASAGHLARAASCAMAGAMLWIAVLPIAAIGQAADSERTITIPAPKSGVIYIRSGLPGGVQIRSRHTTRRERPGALQNAVRQDSDVSPLGFRPVDLSRLEALLARQGLDLDLHLARRRGEDVVVLRRRADGSVTDTLSLAEAANLLESMGGRTGAVGAANVPPLVTRIERSILEAGLFRSLQVNFEFDRTSLLPTAGPTLDAVASVLERFPELRIEVAGHADSVGSEAYNRRLSGGRAEQVRQSLIERGVRPDRVRAQGYGEAQPVLSNRSATGRAMNRRVEFVVLNSEATEQYRLRTPQDPEEQLERLRESVREGIRDGFEDTRPKND